jgi:hypothetical protein
MSCTMINTPQVCSRNPSCYWTGNNCVNR